MSSPGQVAIPPALTADAVELALKELVAVLGKVADAWSAHKAALAAARAEVHAQAQADLDAVDGRPAAPPPTEQDAPRSSDSDLP